MLKNLFLNNLEFTTVVTNIPPPAIYIIIWITVFKSKFVAYFLFVNLGCKFPIKFSWSLDYYLRHTSKPPGNAAILYWLARTEPNHIEFEYLHLFAVKIFDKQNPVYYVRTSEFCYGSFNGHLDVCFALEPLQNLWTARKLESLNSNAANLNGKSQKIVQTPTQTNKQHANAKQLDCLNLVSLPQYLLKLIRNFN